MKARDVRELAENAAEPFREQVRAQVGPARDRAFQLGFWEGLNVMRRAVEEALTKEGNP